MVTTLTLGTMVLGARILNSKNNNTESSSRTWNNLENQKIKGKKRKAGNCISVDKNYKYKHQRGKSKWIINSSNTTTTKNNT